MDLAALQNLVKRDPEAYREEFELQRRHFDTQLQIFTLKPHADSDNFESLITFLSHVAPSYPQAMGSFPQQLMDLLEQQASALEPSLRLCIAKVQHLSRSYLKLLGSYPAEKPQSVDSYHSSASFLQALPHAGQAYALGGASTHLSAARAARARIRAYRARH